MASARNPDFTDLKTPKHHRHYMIVVATTDEGCVRRDIHHAPRVLLFQGELIKVLSLPSAYSPRCGSMGYSTSSRSWFLRQPSLALHCVSAEETPCPPPRARNPRIEYERLGGVSIGKYLIIEYGHLVQFSPLSFRNWSASLAPITN
jgi:hypothetical protein